MHLHRAKNLFFLFSGIVLLATSLMKFVYLGGDHRILQVADPVISFLTYSNLLLITAAFELTIACLLISEKRDALGLLAIAWFSTVLFLYRALHHLSGAKTPCSCLGNISDYTGLTPKQAEACALVALILMLVGSYMLLIFETRRNQISTPPREA